MKLPRWYRIAGDPEPRYLCFRVTADDPDPPLLLLVPDVEVQHPFDVLSIRADDPRLEVWADDGGGPYLVGTAA